MEEDAGEEFIVHGAGMETHGLICRYKDNEVKIADIGVSSGDGNLIALKGPSGCGKTTLLRLLLKLYPYAEGIFKFFDQEIGMCSRRSVRDNIAYVPQENVI